MEKLFFERYLEGKTLNFGIENKNL
jgi:hypothetical protein